MGSISPLGPRTSCDRRQCNIAWPTLTWASLVFKGPYRGLQEPSGKMRSLSPGTRGTKHRGKGWDVVESEKMLWDRYNGISPKIYTICCLFYFLSIIAFVHCSPGSLFIWLTAVASSDLEHASALPGVLAKTQRTRLSDSPGLGWAWEVVFLTSAR